MKSTYKLLGVHFDILPETKTKHQIIPYNDTIADYKCIEKCSDKHECRINLSELFKVENNDELQLMLTKLRNIDSIIIYLDICAGDNVIIDNFIRKRLNQIVYLLEYNLNSNIILMSSKK